MGGAALLADTAPAGPGSPGAYGPPEAHGSQRDEVRMLLSSSAGHEGGRFADLPRLLSEGDVLVVNRSATLPAAIAGQARCGPITVHLSTAYGPRLWLAELRRSPSTPGPLPLGPGDRLLLGGVEARLIAAYPGIPRLSFLEFAADPAHLLEERGAPVRYGHSPEELPLEMYQTIFADRPGSAEMPSAARPFSHRTVEELERAGVELAKLTLHCGVSSLESGDLPGGELFPEPFEVPAETTERLNAALARGRRLIAVGTTVVRALASAWDGRRFLPTRGMTRLFVRPGIPLPPLHGLLTGFHDPEATHLAMLEAVAGRGLVDEGYRVAREGGYQWHEFGDLHLLLPGSTA